MKKIVLMGNPNVGKSVVFARLTGAQVISSNYPGTTIDYSKGKLRIEGERAEIIDAPGTYSLEPSNKAEEVAVKLLHDADLVINVVDATNLERNLYLTLELLEQDVPMVVALNMWDETAHEGIDINVAQLQEMLHVPVIPTVALTGEGFRDLVLALPGAHAGERPPAGEEERWIDIGHIIRAVQHVEHRHHTVWDRLADATIMPASGIPIAIIVLLASFWLIQVIGETFITYLMDPLFEAYRPLAMELSEWLGPGLLHDILVGQLIEGGIDYEQSMGMLTTGLYVPFGMVLPYIGAFYLLLSLLEDSGYLPRLATLTDNVFHKLGMHGYGIVPVFMGLGCNVPGMLATRNLETRKQRFIAATLLAIAVPCMAQTAMIFGILGPHGLRYILLVVGVLIATYVVAGLLLTRVVAGESPEIFMEIPPYRRPSLSAITTKTWMRIRGFLAEAIPFLFLGVFLINILYSAGVLQWLGDVFSPFTHGWLGLPSDASTALLIGFLRKDLAIGMLLSLDMGALQLVIAAVVLTIYFPCVATFAVMLRELGLRDLFKAAAIMLVTATLVGGLLRIVLLGLGGP
ncbi:MAG: FeoB small GTPase domain-containing protein [Thermoplasmatota archaeon]